MKDFLTADWWLGIQGIAATLALITVAIAAIDLIIKLNQSKFNAVWFNLEKTPSTRRTLEPHEIVQCRISARPMGPTIWYEAYWQVFGVKREYLPEPPPVITSADEPVEITLSIPFAQLHDVWVGIAWVEPRRLGSRSRGSRISLMESRYQRWETYWWYWWPRKNAGRWVENPFRTPRLLASPGS